MKPTRPTEDEIGEYVDGRLSERRRAEIAAWLAENPKKAAEVERLRGLDEALRSIATEVLSEPVPDRLREVLRRQRPQDHERRPTKRALSGFFEIAAAFAIFALGTATGWGGHAVLDKGTSEIEWLLADASYAFGFYTSHHEPSVEFPADKQAQFATVATRVFERDIPPPDLRAAGYRYVGARVLPVGARASALLLFEGDQERDDLTVFLWPADQTPEVTLKARMLGDVASRYWVDRGFGFAVMGPKDNARIDQIADQVSEFYRKSVRTPEAGDESADDASVRDDKT